jgi:hypothetical protein
VKFLEAGAAGTSGTVAEPYAIPHKFPVPYVHVHYAQGASMAEAMYQSVYGPYQLMVLGDPLARPFAAFAKVDLAGPARAKPWSGTVSVEARVEPAAGHPVGSIELWVDGRYVGEAPVGEAIPWDTTLAEDGAHEIRLVAVEASAIETRSAASVPVHVQNGTASIRVTPPKEAVPADGTLRLGGSARGVTEVSVVEGSRILATAPVKGGTWKAEVPAEALGTGTVPLVVSGQGRGSPGVRSEWVVVTVEAAAAKPAEPAKPDKPPKPPKPTKPPKKK